MRGGYLGLYVTLNETMVYPHYNINRMCTSENHFNITIVIVNLPHTHKFIMLIPCVQFTCVRCAVTQICERLYVYRQLHKSNKTNQTFLFVFLVQNINIREYTFNII